MRWLVALLAVATTNPSQISYSVTGGAKRPLADKLSDVVSVKDYGAKGDGVADDTAAIQAALAVSGRVLLPCPGTYKATLTGVVNSGPYACGIYGTETHFDGSANATSLISILHNGSGGTQTYGLDIHNYPDSSSAPTAGTGAHSALAIHQYSDRDQAVQIDQVRSGGMLILRLTHNEVLATGEHGTGPYIDFVGYTAGKPYPANNPVLMGRLEGGTPGTPLTFSSKETDTPWAFRSDSTAPSLKLSQSNAGVALSVLSSNASLGGITIAQSSSGAALNISADSNASGFFPMIVTGYSHGPKFTTTINSGPALTLSQTVAGGNQVFFIDNRGSGSSIRLSSDGSNTTYSVSGTGAVLTTSTQTKGTCTLNAASPATCTAVVLSGAVCVATAVGTTAAAAIPLAVSVTGTVMTITAANGATSVVNYHCFG